MFLLLGLSIPVILVVVIVSRTSRSRDNSRATASAGWYRDPMNRFELRYFGGAEWTGNVSAAGVQSTDPLTTSPPPS